MNLLAAAVRLFPKNQGNYPSFDSMKRTAFQNFRPLAFRPLEAIHSGILFCGILAAGLQNGFADSFTDSLSTNINPTFWHAWTDSSRFTVQTTNGMLHIQSIAGTTNGFYGGYIYSTLTASGNFDVSIDFTNANLVNPSGTVSNPANQAQLNCFFGDFSTDTNFFVVRDNEKDWGQNYHVWIGYFANEGGRVLGSMHSTSLNYGTLRVTRTNSLVTGYLNSQLVAQTNYVTNPVHFSICLQNNGTSDAISINYNNFRLAADQITVGPPLSVQPSSSNNVLLSWPTWGVGWTTNYLLEYTTGLNNPNWQPVASVPTTNAGQFNVTDSVAGAARFYKLIQP